MKAEHYRKDPPRLWIFYLIFGGIFLFLLMGLGYRQVIQHEAFLRQEKQQSLRRIVQPGTRGNILDRNGNLLVGNRPLFSAVVYLGELRAEFKKEYSRQLKMAKAMGEKINRSKLRKKSREIVLERYLMRLNRLLGRQAVLDYKDVERHFSQRLLLPFTLIQDLSLEEYAFLTERIPVNSPIQIYIDSTRYYPYGAMACHVLGYVGSSFDIPEAEGSLASLKTFSVRGKCGRNGLEKAFDDYLQGKSGEEIWLVDPAGFQCERLKKTPPAQGNCLTTTLDLKVQLAAEKALGDKTGAIIVMDVNTGEVLAMTSHPNYDLNLLVPRISTEVYDAINTKGAWLNRATQGLYPPGSPYKLITGIAGLREGLIPEDRVVDCTGGLLVGNRIFPCMKRSGHGPLRFEEAIAYSCNPFFYQVAIQMGPDRLAEESRRMGLGQPTGIELPFEAQRTLVPTPSWKKERRYERWMQGDTANMAIGQGFLLATPLQMVCFAAALARGECTTRPYLLHDPLHPSQKTEPLGLSRKDYERILDGMEKATLIGTGKRMKINNLRIAAKTGTAQTSVRGEEMDLAWCAAFAPIEAPKVAIIVVVEEVDKKDRFQGGLTASPIAKEVLLAVDMLFESTSSR